MTLCLVVILLPAETVTAAAVTLLPQTTQNKLNLKGKIWGEKDDFLGLEGVAACTFAAAYENHVMLE